MATASVGSDAGSSPTRLKSQRSGGLAAALDAAFHRGASPGRRGSGAGGGQGGSLLRRLSGGSDASGGAFPDGRAGSHTEGRGSLDSWGGRLSWRASKAGEEGEGREGEGRVWARPGGF